VAGLPGLRSPTDRAGGPSSQEFRKVSENSEQLCGTLCLEVPVSTTSQKAGMKKLWL